VEDLYYEAFYTPSRTKTPRGYIEEVQELAMAIPDAWDQSVVSMFARGIKDAVTREVLNAYTRLQATSKTVKLDEVIRVARACEDDQTAQIAEDIAASLSKDEMFSEALNNQNQLIGTIARAKLDKTTINTLPEEIFKSTSQVTQKQFTMLRIYAPKLKSIKRFREAREDFGLPKWAFDKASNILRRSAESRLSSCQGSVRIRGKPPRSYAPVS
jgi:hypothetical protein